MGAFILFRHLSGGNYYISAEVIRSLRLQRLVFLHKLKNVGMYQFTVRDPFLKTEPANGPKLH